MPDAPSLITAPLPDQAAHLARPPRYKLPSSRARHVLAQDGSLLAEAVASPIDDNANAPVDAIDGTRRFALLTDEHLAILRALLDSAWHSAAQGRVLACGEITLLPDFFLSVGGLAVPLADVIDAAPALGGEPDELAFLMPDGRVEHLRRFRPLVAYAAFGAAELFATLACSLESLRVIGGYAGEVAVITDLPEQQLADLLPPEAAPWHHCPAEALDLLDYTAARFAIIDYPALAACRPVLYLDTDVICDQPVAPVLEVIFLSGRLCLAGEHELLHTWDFYGASLFAADPTARPQSGRGASNGVIGLASMELAHAAFAPARRALQAHADRHGRGALTYMDQAMGSYVWHKTMPLDLDSLSARVVNLGGWRDEPPDDLAPRGFMHFSGGIGNAAAKLDRMRRYRRRLDAA